MPMDLKQTLIVMVAYFQTSTSIQRKRGAPFVRPRPNIHLATTLKSVMQTIVSMDGCSSPHTNVIDSESFVAGTSSLLQLSLKSVEASQDHRQRDSGLRGGKSRRPHLRAPTKRRQVGKVG
jgi:hypothetical protein